MKLPFYRVLLPVLLLQAACTAPQTTVYLPVSPSAQTSAPVVPATVPQRYRLAPNHWEHVAKIRAEAQRLGLHVAEKQLTKVQAAQYLNRFRLSLVGANPVDDDVYAVYQRAAVDSQRGAIDSAQSKALVESTLQGWRQRWNKMPDRPANPAFTNFLMEVMGLEPLQ